MQGCSEKYRKPHGGEDDFPTTPAGLDFAWTNRMRVTFSCGLVNSAVNLLYHFLYPLERFIDVDFYNWRKNRVFAFRKEFFEKYEEYSVTKQVGNFLSIAHSYAS